MDGFDPELIARGGYVLSGEDDDPEIVFVATGSEVPLAASAAAMLGDTFSIRVVSMPCVELYLAQEAAYREKLIPASAKKVVVEAGATSGWREIVGGSESDTLLIGIDHFGASAPHTVIAEKFGFSPEAIVEKVKSFV